MQFTKLIMRITPSLLKTCVVLQLIFPVASAADENRQRSDRTPAVSEVFTGERRTRVDYSRLTAGEGAIGKLDTSGDQPAYIGSHANGGEFFHGAIDDLRIYDASLSAADVAGLAKGELEGKQESLKGWWKLDGDSTNRAGPERDAEKPTTKPIGSPPEFIAGRHGQAMLFNGRDQTLRIESYAGLKSTTNTTTIAAWIKPSSAPDEWMEIYRKEDNSARQLLAIGSSGYFGLWAGLGIDGRYVEVGGQIDRQKLLDGQWHHVAVTYDGRLMRLFLDGRMVRSHDPLGGEDIEVDETDERLRVAFLGNTLIHRDADFGFLETEITRLFPERDIVFRNLGWPGDTVDGSARVEFGPGESTGFGWQPPKADVADYGFRKMMTQIRRERPDVLLIAYGSNVAFSQQDGLESFRAGLSRLLDAIEPTGATVILLTPPPREPRDLLAEPLATQNVWLRKVAEIICEVAAERDLAVVDLFSRWADEKPPTSWTDNGIHLNRDGYRRLAETVVDTLLADRIDRWQLTLAADGTIVEANGTNATTAKATEYGLRWNVTDKVLPSSVSPASDKSRRRLRIRGLAPGTYSLDIDGRRSARGTGKQWSEGIEIRGGPDHVRVEQLRNSIIEKNRQNFYRYRPQNKAYIQLFRRYERGHHAAEIERFEILVRESETEIARLRQPASRIYELVKEKDYPDHEVPAEKFAADVDEELASFAVPEGFEINLFASNPLISKPLNMNWDERGRMWVSSSSIYPHLQPGQTPNDRILILEDVDQDGRADKSTVFADDLLVPHSVLPTRGGVFVTQSTDLLFLKDNDGDDRADEKQVVLTGFGNADVHHMIHGLRWGPDGDLYFLQSIYINSDVETPWGVERCNGACLWRLRPETLRMEKHATGLVNPWGHAFDDWGQSFLTDGAGGGGIAYGFPGAAFRTNGYAGRELRTLNEGRPKECGLEHLGGRHLPADWRGTFMTNDFRANRSTRYRTRASQSGYQSDYLGESIASRHRGFRPIDIKMGPDGAIYIADWYNLIIDHGEVDFHHPLRDKQHGRIWRLTRKGSPLVPRPKIVGASNRKLLELLTEPEPWTRDQARRALREREPAEVLNVLRTWVAEPERTEHDLLEALWVCQGLRVVNDGLLERLLRAPDHRARAAATRVLQDWHDRVPSATTMLQRRVADPHPQVRLEAVNALRRIGSREAVDLALAAIDHPMDVNLDFALFRTVHELRNQWLPDLRAGRWLTTKDPQHIAFALSSIGDEASLAPLAKLVESKSLTTDRLVNALAVLAALGDSSQRELVVSRIEELDAPGKGQVLAAFSKSTRQNVPKNASAIVEWIGSSHDELRRPAISLAGRWKLAAASPSLEATASNLDVSISDRIAAGKSLIAIDREKGIAHIRRVLASTTDSSLRASAIAALASGAIDEAANLAVAHVREHPDETLAPVIDEIIARQDGDAQLTKALHDVVLGEPTARSLIERVQLSGREMNDLVAAARRAAKLPPLTGLTPGEIAAILREVAAGPGDVELGRQVFTRSTTQCSACHVVKGDGGKIGPDLSSIGATSTTAELLQSIVDPAANIKQGFHTTVIATLDGGVHSGIVQQQTEQLVTLRDAKNELHSVAAEDIDSIKTTQTSLMPTALTEQLTREELAALVRYLATLTGS